MSRPPPGGALAPAEKRPADSDPHPDPAVYTSQELRRRFEDLLARLRANRSREALNAELNPAPGVHTLTPECECHLGSPCISPAAALLTRLGTSVSPLGRGEEHPVPLLGLAEWPGALCVLGPGSGHAAAATRPALRVGRLSPEMPGSSRGCTAPGNSGTPAPAGRGARRRAEEGAVGGSAEQVHRLTQSRIKTGVTRDRCLAGWRAPGPGAWNFSLKLESRVEVPGCCCAPSPHPTCPGPHSQRSPAAQVTGEAEAGGSREPRSSKPVGATWRELVSNETK